MPIGLDVRATDRVSGPAWKAIKPHIDAVNAALLGVSLTSRGELTRIYIKYTSAETGCQPFAVMWVRSSSEIVIGLAPPARLSYREDESPLEADRLQRADNVLLPNRPRCIPCQYRDLVDGSVCQLPVGL